MTIFTNHHLTAEHVNDKSGPAVMLTQQEDIEDAATIIIHPWQLVAACQHLGLAASDPKAAKDIATLQRRMLVLRDRIDHLAEYLALHSDSKHADLSYEQTYATATADIAEEFCAELNDCMGHAVSDAENGTVQEQSADAKASPSPAPRQMAMEV